MIFEKICDYGEENITFLQNELCFDFPNGIPSEDTLERVCKRLCPKEIEKALVLAELTLISASAKEEKLLTFIENCKEYLDNLSKKTIELTQ